MFISKTIHRTFLSVVTLVILCIVSGVIYVYFTDSDEKLIITPPQASNVDSSSFPAATPPGANSPEGAAIASVTSPVNAGSNASIYVITNAGSTCTIAVSYNGVLSDDSGLIAKTSNAYGSVSWTWTVGSTVPIGNWPIKVVCTYHGRSAVVTSSLQVTK